MFSFVNFSSPIHLPQFDPNIFTLFGFSIRWYSMAYVIGIIFCYFFIKKQNEKRHFMNSQAQENLITYMIFSIILGGRFGYVFFYNLSYYLENPLQIFAFWHGGMSFHGGLAGVILGMILFTRNYKIKFFLLTDLLAISCPIGIFLGRIANFINLELYGRVTESKFGMIFPNAGILPRHPSQLYEASLEGLLMFIILISFFKFTKVKNFHGALSGGFLALYGIFRIIIENFREPDNQIGFIFNFITMGQLLSIPMIICGISIIFHAYNLSFKKIKTYFKIILKKIV